MLQMTKPLFAILLLLPLCTSAFAEAESYRCKAVKKMGTRYDGKTDTVSQVSYRIDELDEYRVLSHKALVAKVGSDKFREWLTDKYPFKTGEFYAQQTFFNPYSEIGWTALLFYVEDYFTSKGDYGDAFYFHAGNRRLEVQPRGASWAYAGSEKVHDTARIFAECLAVYD